MAAEELECAARGVVDAAGRGAAELDMRDRRRRRQLRALCRLGRFALPLAHEVDEPPEERDDAKGGGEGEPALGEGLPEVGGAVEVDLDGCVVGGHRARGDANRVADAEEDKPGRRADDDDFDRTRLGTAEELVREFGHGDLVAVDLVDDVVRPHAVLLCVIAIRALAHNDGALLLHLIVHGVEPHAELVTLLLVDGEGDDLAFLQVGPLDLARRRRAATEGVHGESSAGVSCDVLAWESRHRGT